MSSKIKSGQLLWLLSFLACLLFLRTPELATARLTNQVVLHIVELWQIERQQIDVPSCRVQGTHQELEILLQDILDRNPSYDRGKVNLGRVYWLEGRCPDAIALWRLAWERQTPEAAFELTLIAEEVELSDETRVQLAYLIYQKGRTAHRQGLTSNAQYWYERSLVLEPGRKMALAPLAGIYLEQGNRNLAVALWQAFSETLPDTDSDHWWSQAKIAEIEEKWGDAAQAYLMGATLAAQPFEFYYAAGTAWERLPDWDNALTAYEQALQEQPDDVRLYRRIGDIYFRLEEYAEAKDFYVQGTEREPDNYIFFHGLGRSSFALADFVSAQEQFEMALKLAPEHAASAYYLAQVHYKRGNYELAESWLKEAIDREQRPTGTWRLQLGDWYMEWNSCQLAAEAYASAGQFGASDTVVQNRLEQLALACPQKP